MTGKAQRLGEGGPKAGQLDLFVALPGDLPTDDQQEMMERPFFSLSKNKRLEPIDYRVRNGTTEIRVRVTANSETGMATIWDADILIWAASQMREAMNRGIPTSRKFRVSLYELLKGIGRPTGGAEYTRIVEALRRLKGTVIETTIRQKGTRPQGFGWIEEWAAPTDEAGKSLGIEFTIAEWLYQGIRDDKLVLSIDREYFQLGPVTAKLCRVATALQNTRFVKSADPDLQQYQAPRHHAPNMPSGEVSKDMVDARSEAARKLLTSLASAANGQNPQLRGHWAMFGVTTPCVNQLVAALHGEYDCLVFHATGTGGQSMEKLAESGLLRGLIDVTTTEVCDLLIGGVFPCTEDRFGAVARSRLPYVGSCGALDMVNFGALASVPARFQERNLYVHNEQVTLMRTTPEECERIGRWIGERLNRCEGPVRFLLPEGGVSALDAPGAAFHDPAADAALFRAIEQTVAQTDARRVVRHPGHVNAPEFAHALVEHFHAITEH